MYIFCPITKTFNAEESRPFLIPHEFIQPIEIPILEFIHNTKYNHKLYNLIQNTPYEFAVGTEELKTIKALQLIWPLLQTKKIIRILAKLLTNSDIIHDIFPHGFFPDDVQVYVQIRVTRHPLHAQSPRHSQTRSTQKKFSTWNRKTCHSQPF